MAILVILVLVGLWAVVLLPPILRSRSTSGMGGVSTFMDSLRSLGRGNGGAPRDPMMGRPVLHGPVGGSYPGPGVGSYSGPGIGSYSGPGVGSYSGPGVGPYAGPSGRPTAPVGAPGRAAPGAIVGSMTPMQRRRRNLLFGLAGATALFFLVGLVTGSTLLWLLFLLAAGALGGYVYLLLQFKKSRLAVAQSGPVRMPSYLNPVASDDEPRYGDNVVVLRRSVG